ncbi:membrane-spanning 4-domains subfamily A member 8-like [Phyllobates terribilis]|uniref:membrane-spanning 4-domains subfamily A member 8-like n=1 Tax=Phyllobates terribilis TaxID=111132 RepID=UPI003CCAC88C
MAFPATNEVFIVGSQENTVSLPVEHIQTPPYHQTFFKGQPKALGAVQISLGFVQILVGTVLLYTFNAYTSVTAYSFIVYWGGAWYIISGSVMVAAADKTSRSLVKGTLATNVISSLIALCEVSLVIIDIAHTYYYRYGPCFTNPCSLFQDTILVIRLITLIHLILITFLQFSMSSSAVAFSILSLKQKTPTVPQCEQAADHPMNKPNSRSSSQILFYAAQKIIILCKQDSHCREQWSWFTDQ